MFLMVTGGFVIPSTHDPSHGAGHTRPVNSGKLLVLCSRSSASRQSPRIDQRSFHSGIRLLIGQPEAMPLIKVPGVTEWNAAVHTAAALLLKFALGKMLGETPPSHSPARLA